MIRRWTTVVGVDASWAGRVGLARATREAAPGDAGQHLTAGPSAHPNEARDAAEALLLGAIESVPRRRSARIIGQPVEGVLAEALVNCRRTRTSRS
jgi:hypothetical protein